MKLSKIDNLDMRILSNLLNNCRESDRQIGQKIGLSGVAVKSRINKMLKSKLIEKFTLKIEPHLLGYNVIYLVTTGQDVNEIVNQVKLVGEPFFVVPCIGDTMTSISFFVPKTSTDFPYSVIRHAHYV